MIFFIQISSNIRSIIFITMIVIRHKYNMTNVLELLAALTVANVSTHVTASKIKELRKSSHYFVRIL